MSIEKDLKFIGDTLPTGAIKRISEKCDFSQGYVSKFFNGEYNLNERNSVILDEVEIILSEQAVLEKENGKKLKNIISKTK